VQTAAKNFEGPFVVTPVSRKWITILNQRPARNSFLCLRFREHLNSWRRRKSLSTQILSQEMVTNLAALLPK